MLRMVREKATFGMGCFWGVEALFGGQPGVLRTKVGYSGGTTPNPTYHQIGDYVEAVEMEYDPEKTNYENLLKVFWANHEPTSKPYKRQYISAILYHNEEQKNLAGKSMKEEQSRHSRAIKTEILPADKFFDAEDYHQKYNLRCNRWLCDSLGLSDGELKASEVATKLNAYCCGVRNLKQFEEESKGLQLSNQQIEYIKERIKSGVSPHC